MTAPSAAAAFDATVYIEPGPERDRRHRKIKAAVAYYERALQAACEGAERAVGKRDRFAELVTGSIADAAAAQQAAADAEQELIAAREALAAFEEVNG